MPSHWPDARGSHLPSRVGEHSRGEHPEEGQPEAHAGQHGHLRGLLHHGDACPHGRQGVCQRHRGQWHDSGPIEVTVDLDSSITAHGRELSVVSCYQFACRISHCHFSRITCSRSLRCFDTALLGQGGGYRASNDERRG